MIQIGQGAGRSAAGPTGGDDLHPEAGGLGSDQPGGPCLVPKDFWRLVTGTADEVSPAGDVLALDPAAPAELAAFRYGSKGSKVVEILDPGLPHPWPDCNVMALAMKLFDGN